MESVLSRVAVASPKVRIQGWGLVFLAALLLPWPAFAASTGDSALLIVQGRGATTEQGDYISTTDGAGRNTYYSFFIEVPPSLSRLDIDIFDADIGAGGAGDATGNRDRERTAYNTSVNYSLRLPDGTAVTPQFTTGSATLPAGGNNAWLNFFSGNVTFRDEFNAAAYNNNNGTTSWSTSWTETGDGGGGGGGVSGGGIQVVADPSVAGNFRLRLQDTNRNIQREANLPSWVGSATLSFSYRRNALDDANDFVAIDASNNGGGSWTEVARFAGPGTDASYTLVSYDISAYIATNTRIRFRTSATLGSADQVYFDNVNIAAHPVAGHWELRVDQSSAVTTGDDINAFGLRAHDGDSTSGGTEIPVYAHSFMGYGTNSPSLTRNYTHYPYITSGCVADNNDFDWDSDAGSTGSIVYHSRTNAFTRTITPAQNDQWKNSVMTGWASDSDAVDYGIWESEVSITGYNPGSQGNYGVIWLGNSSAANGAPTAQPQTNSFRIYLPTDAGAAPPKPYLEQLLRHTCTGVSSGPNPPNTGQTSCFTVTVRVVNPSSQSITFSTPSNIVTSNVPAVAVTYGGGAQVSQGTIVSQPSVGGTGNVTWNPGTVAAGATALISYRVNVTPTSNGQRVPVTGIPTSNGTQAQYVDETANTTQTRATYLQGPLCGLAATEDVITAAVVSGLTAQAGPGGVAVSWETVSEVGTVGFDLYRWSPEQKKYEQVNRQLLTARLEAPQGSRYRFVDSGADPAAPQRYLLVEVEASGERRRHGPFRVRVAPETWAKEAVEDDLPFSSQPRPMPARAAAEKANGQGPLRKAEAIRIGVDADGLYLVRTEDLAAILDLKPEKLAKVMEKGQISITNRGQEVAWTFAAGGTGVLFYGQAPIGLDSLYTRENVYRLTAGTRGLQMAALPGSSPSPAPGLSFLDTVHAEADRLAATVVTTNPDTDWWFWDYVNAGGASDGKRTFPVQAPDLSGTGGTARLKVTLHGATSTNVADEHHAIVRVNGTEVGETRWSGLTETSFEVDLSPSLLVAGENAVEVEAVLDSGVPYSIFYVDGFDLTYPRTYRAAGDALALRGDGNAAVTVAGFADSRIAVLDVTDPKAPRLLAGVALDGTAGDYRATFTPAAASARYLAVSPAGWRSPSSLRGDAFSSLQARQGADYLVITANDLLAPARELATLRQRQGLLPVVVDVEDVYDEFNAGLASPKAIRDFLAYARQRWSPAPRFVVLAGAGTFDYRDNLGFGGNLLPPLLVSTSNGLFAADNRFGDVTGGDGVPEMAVGRLPVRTAAELSAYVQKIVAYEAAAPADWSGRALVVTDNAEDGVDFHAEGDELAAVLPEGYTITSLEYTGGSAEALRSELVSRLNDGVGLFGYVGHGALDRLAAEGLLQATDVAGLGNGSRLPVMTALTCIINRFELPYFPPLGADLVRKAGGGAAAVWAPSGLSFSNESRALGERFYLELVRPGGERVGEAIRRSLEAYAASGGLPEVLDLYNLLGDPALRVKSPAPPPVTGGTGGPE
ncbi:MAG TPA: C25 family cysteine peptidase [Thermoanaerobaculia bacterium]|nr:C25 family cysteine peptidase [Thermoanaerobaculia bacterium]